MRHLPSSLETKIETLKQCRYFENIDDQAIQQLANGTHLYAFERAETIFWEGEKSLGLYIIQSGSVKLFKISLQGRQMVINTFSEGDSFNEVPVFDHSGNPVNVAAIEDSQIWIVRTDAIHQAMADYPEMAQTIILNLSKNLRTLVGLVEELSFFQVTNRLARLIQQLPRKQLQGEADQRLTQDELAARLGTVREVVARSLKELERSGAIRVSRRQIIVVDDEALRDWALLPCDE